MPRNNTFDTSALYDAKEDVLSHKLLIDFVKTKASDLRIISDEVPYITKNNETLPLEKWDVLTKDTVQEMLWSLVSVEQWEKYQDQWSLDASFELDGIARFRLNYYYEKDKPTAVLRLIESKAPDIDQLRLPQVFKALSRLPRGLILITGPTNSGKSVSLSAIVNHINKTRKVSIQTIEDPVEFIHQNINSLITQCEVGRDVSNYKQASFNLLRQAPNVIVFGELRDPDVIKVALTMAETGHLVIGTLHTSSAASTISRILNTFDANEHQQIRASLAGSLKAIICQTLLLTKDMESRIGAFEICVLNDEMQKCILEGNESKLEQLIIETKDQGNKTLDMAIYQLIKQGVVDRASALSKANDPQLIESKL